MSDIIVKDLIENLDFHLVNKNSNIENKINSAHILNLGLELIGVIDEEDFHKIIVVGKKEIRYILEHHIKSDFKKLTAKTPCIIICDDGLKEINSFISNDIKTPILSTNKSIDDVMIDIYSYLTPLFAPSKNIHGTLVSVYGLGILLTGASGIGKSEIALELIKRGHRLVADDSVKTFILNNKLYGRAMDHQKNLLEVRGLGLVDVYRLFGVNAILDTMPINLVINLVGQEEMQNVNRLQDPLLETTINNTKCPMVRIPLNRGRNVADIIEVAVMDFRNREMGYSATKEFIEKYDSLAKGEK